MSAQVAAAKRLSIVVGATARENGFLDFTSTRAKNALERESAFVLSAAGQASFRLRRNHADPPPAIESLSSTSWMDRGSCRGGFQTRPGATDEDDPAWLLRARYSQRESVRSHSRLHREQSCAVVDDPENISRAVSAEAGGFKTRPYKCTASPPSVSVRRTARSRDDGPSVTGSTVNPEIAQG